MPATPLVGTQSFSNQREFRESRSWVSSLLPLRAPRPRNQYNWPNPVQSVRTLQSWTSGSSTPIVARLSTPFNQYNWPNPVQPIRLIQSWTSGPSSPMVARPFNQYYWPNPLPLPRVDGTWINQGITAPPPIPPPIVIQGGGKYFEEWLEEARRLSRFTPEQRFASLGGKARALILTPKQRTEIARHAAHTRWK